MKKKILSLCLVVALAATAIVGASMAYLTDEESEVNVMTLGNVQITQNEQERGESGLQNFTQAQTIYPAVFDDYSSKEELNANGWTVKIRDKVENYVDKIVSVTNDGASDAYVRTIIAVPEAGNFDTTYNAAEQWLHWNGVSDTDNNPGNGWMWGKDRSEWPSNTNNWDVVENVKIGDKVYDIYVATNKNVLEPGETTAPSLLGFYLDPGVDFDGTNYTFGSYNLGDISNLEILVATQAVQAAGFSDAWTALDEAFGDITTTNHPWSDGVVIPTVVNVATAAEAQAALDNAVSGTIIMLAPNVNYGTLAIRPTANNETTLYCETHDYTSDYAEDFKAHLADGNWHTTPKYTTTLNDVTIIGAEGATVEGMTATSGHAYGDVYDYVLSKDYDVGSAYYNTLHISNLTFKNVAFTGKVDINTSDANTTYDGVTFEGCTFTTGGTASSNGAAIRYYNESNNGNVKNLVVKNCTFNSCYQGVYTHHVNGVTVTDCTFDTLGHNAVAVQVTDTSCNHGNVVITGNTFKNIGDRVIRFNNVGAGSNIVIQNNVAINSGDEDGEVMKATSIAEGVTTSIKNNQWGSGVVANDELKDK